MCAMFSLHAVNGQNTFKALISDGDSKEPLSGATASIQGTAKGAIADSEGIITIPGVPNGTYKIEFRYIGYKASTMTFVFPLASGETALILLEPEAEEFEEIIVSSTRSTRTIQDIPTRVESIAGEELEEKSNMKSGDIRMLLSESTGIQTQQTSATSANASIRIQGLDGRYTQILKDGFPLYSGAANGLGLLQTPPLDLRQVEVIKGSASTLYGGGAIAGLVNLISKTPTEKRDLLFHLNGTSGPGYDLNIYYGQRFKKIGTTIFASKNGSRAYDPAGIDLSAIPEFNRYVFNPKVFFYFDDKTSLNIGLNTTIEDRLGGDIHLIRGDADNNHNYYERNKTKRYSTQLSFDHRFNEKQSVTIKNSLSYFNREISIPDYTFDGIQAASFTEISYNNKTEKSEWIGGINIWTDNFQEVSKDAFLLRNYNQVTLGAFVQNSWQATSRLNFETGFRGDYVRDYGFIFLPRISALFKFNDSFSSRIGGGFGYKSPTIFTEESERIQYRHVLPINNERNVPEKSYGFNADLNYRTTFFRKLTFSLNQLLFYTYIKSPLLLEIQTDENYLFVNSSGYMDTRGTETNIKLGYNAFKLFLGYTYTDTRLHQNGNNAENPLTPRHRLNAILMYEVEDKWKIGLESYYFSRQKLSDGAFGKQYTILGFMAERLWEKFSIYVNLENFLDVRQTRFDTIYSGPIIAPVFRDIYAPLDGFMINAGIKFRL